MIEVGKIYTCDTSDLAIEIVKITFEADTHYRVMGNVFNKNTMHWYEGIKEYNIEKSTIAHKRWKEYEPSK